MPTIIPITDTATSSFKALSDTPASFSGQANKGIAINGAETSIEFVDFSLDTHNHDDLYYTEAEITSLLAGKSDTGHDHPISEILNLQTSLNAKSDTGHNHNADYYTKFEINALLSAGSGTGGGTIPVIKATAGTINALDPIQVVGYDNVEDRYLVEIATADSQANIANAIASNSFTDASEGLAVVDGMLEDVNASAYSEGDILYLTVAGGLSTTKPTGSTEVVQPVAVVMSSDASEGALLVFGAVAEDISNTVTLRNDMDASSNKITNLADPTADQDAATKAYVDTKHFAVAL